MARTSLKLVEDKRSVSKKVDAVDCAPTSGATRRFEGELWTAQQRQMHSLHYVVSYRGSFKPELPDFCIKRYSKKGDVVLDPFSGRGTTALQANLLGRVAWAADINPLAVRISRAKSVPAGLDEIVLRLNEVDFRRPVGLGGFKESFAPFYHPDTYRELLNLKSFLAKQQDRVSSFVELLAISRLHGHSPGFFSVYSFPQISIPPESQRLINQRRHQQPEYRAVAPRIIKKAAQSLRDGFTGEFIAAAKQNRIEVADSRNLDFVPADSVDLIVTSPPFLDKVDYLLDNWLEFWFSGISPKSCSANLVMCRSLVEWRAFISDVMKEMLRVLKPRACAVIEVGEVESGGSIVNLDEVVAEEARKVRTQGKLFSVEEVLINKQSFTKLSNCFRVDNNTKGTNTNRMVVLRAMSARR